MKLYLLLCLLVVGSTGSMMNNLCKKNIVALVDVAGSITNADLFNYKDTLKNLAMAVHLENQAKIGTHCIGYQMAIITFASTTTLVTNMTADFQTTLNAINGIVKTNGITRTHLGLVLAGIVIEENNMNNMAGIVLITDGLSTFPSATFAAASNLKKNGVDIFVLDVGNVTKLHANGKKIASPGMWASVASSQTLPKAYSDVLPGSCFASKNC
eukprot:TRINITY_DN94562_c0_g1_i1.p1 TRINITY_DN94562_c0_g1~~TRINITY_DN94562_c0_g1_i1.p1  ORF type:complete len:213 (+),score=24.62 TRINITY_DN94562_c0_g1_i1:36-674(+)